jgi:hypothetical protein
MAVVEGQEADVLTHVQQLRKEQRLSPAVSTKTEYDSYNRIILRTYKLRCCQAHEGHYYFLALAAATAW